MERSNPYNPEARGGGVGWVAGAGFVFAFDAFAPETMSNFCRRVIEHENPIINKLPHLIGGIMLGHCLDIIPERIDPVDNLSRGVAKLKNFILERTIHAEETPTIPG